MRAVIIPSYNLNISSYKNQNMFITELLLIVRTG
jgi:hypothetical protein